MAEAKDLVSWPTVPPIAGYEKGEMLHYPAIETSGHFEGIPNALAVDDHSEQRATLCLLANCQF